MKKILLLGSMILLTGCGDKTPKCGDESTKQTVVELVKTKSILVGMFARDMIADATISNIRTTEVNKDTHISTCNANLIVKNKLVTDTNAKLAYPISYTVQLTDDGKNIYVTAKVDNITPSKWNN